MLLCQPTMTTRAATAGTGKTKPQCTGMVKSTGLRCRNDALSAKEHCKFHDPERPICQGTTKDKKPCKALARKEFNFEYCRASHFEDAKCAAAAKKPNVNTVKFGERAATTAQTKDAGNPKQLNDVKKHGPKFGSEKESLEDWEIVKNDPNSLFM